MPHPATYGVAITDELPTTGMASEIPTSHINATDDIPHPATYGVAITDELPTTGMASEIPTSHINATDDIPHPATYGVAITDELPTTGMASEIPTSHIYATDDIPHPATDEGVSEEIAIFTDVASKPTERRTNDPEELVTSREPSTEGWQATMTKYSLVKTGKS